MNIKHKHAGHLIIVGGHAFKANDAGMWDLTDIWRTLGLSKTKQPGKWADIKKAKALRETGNIGFAKVGTVTKTEATKRAALSYAGWVSNEFESMVYDAFEAILELPEVAALVADKMTALGNDYSATIIKRMTFNDKCDWKALKAPHKNTQQGLRAAVVRGNITHERALELGLKTKEVTQ
ncbi:hypothetical protein [Pseudomonas capsici]|uniref:KilA N-terminal/APSES-type HTH DNA-binding domain-containing protein n=1 Tax=Pseudomonas capsici TaxID=2810614 RepID=A0ABT3BT36_9PSED|nr:hypothetical protein [Pseudomonas capsici]MCV4266678.1 hypothetical protein [Pseudomonas capsici]MCV4277731.1 hypothetical protein [Pseudomonas capsici]MCV4331282.1 hypothetical protein [Pseudomonas capsici]MCV4376020.1 hypothetical protein [Pseudomonas capsici]